MTNYSTYRGQKIDDAITTEDIFIDDDLSSDIINKIFLTFLTK